MQFFPFSRPDIATIKQKKGGGECQTEIETFDDSCYATKVEENSLSFIHHSV
jgi:hypothetical protein